MNTIALFNASGQQGRAISRALRQPGNSILAPVRSQTAASQIHTPGLNPVVTDFTRQALAPILAQATHVVLQIPVVISPAEMIAFATEAVAAIQAAGSPPTVAVISSIIPATPTGLAGPDARLAIQQLVHRELPQATILSATLYLDNFSQAYREAIVQQGMIPQAIPAHVPVAYLSMDDLATYVLAALQRPELRGRTWTLGGSEALTGDELASQLGAVIGRAVQYTALRPEDLAGFLTPLIGPAVAAQVAEMYAWEGTTGQHLLAPDVAAVQQAFGVQLPSFRQWAAQAFAPVQ